MSPYFFIASFAVICTAWASYFLSRPTSMGSFMSHRGLNLGLLAMWLISKGFAVWTGFAFFPNAIENGTTFDALVVRLRPPEFGLLILIWLSATIRLSVALRPKVYDPDGSRPEWEKR